MALRDIDKRAQTLGARLANYAGLFTPFGLLAAIFSTFLKITRPFYPHGWNWPEAIVLGFGGALGTIFLFSIFLSAWRYFRPLVRTASPDIIDEISSQSIVNTAGSHLKILDGNVKDLNSKFSDVYERQVAILNLIAPIKEDVTRLIELHDRLSNREAALSESIRQFNKESSAATTGISIRVDEFSRTLTKLITDVDRRFLALSHREYLTAKERALEAMTSALDSFPRMDGVSWEDWAVHFSAYRAEMSSWQDVARFYDDASAARIFETPADLFRPKNWTFDVSAFPNEDALHDFKCFRIISRNFEAAKKSVHRQLEAEIF